MFANVVEELLKNACPTTKYRINKEILNRQEDFEIYQPEILEDKRVQYALSWQNNDGYFGEVFHGGWIPREERKYSTTGAESALRFLSEMGFPKENQNVCKGLNVLLNSNWNRGKSSWKDNNNLKRLAQFIDHLIELSPFPDIYIKYRSQLIAPASIFPKDLKKSLKDFGDKDWFSWFHTFELFSRMGIVGKIPVLAEQLSELKEILKQGNGFFRIKPKDYCFNKWSVYIGLALEEDWKKDKWLDKYV